MKYKKLTAVEFIEKAYSDICFNNMTYGIGISKDFMPNLFKLAKEIEKENIGYFATQCCLMTIQKKDFSIEQFYNETFKK